MKANDAAPWALAAIAVVILASSVVQAWPFTVDDTFITLRYARNVAEGIGPTFNAAGPRAEGYTSLSWMLALVVPHAMGLGLDALTVAKAMGVLATFATVVVAARWAWTEAVAASDGNRNVAAWAGATAATCYAAVPATAIHAVSGMETAFFTLVITAMLATAAGVVRDGRATSRLVGLALLGGLTRPEGNLVALVTIATTAALLPRGPRVSLALRATVLWALPVGAYEAWRLGYYGLPFPLPFYVKLASTALAAGWPEVLAYLRGPVLHFGLLALVALARPARSLWPTLGAIASLLAFFVFPRHLMGYEHRYLAPLDPSIGVLAGVGLARLLAPASRLPTVVKNAAAAATIVVSVALEALPTHAHLSGWAGYGKSLAQAHQRLGSDLLALGMPEGRLAISDAGAVPYLSRWWTLDMIGLNDAEIATTGRRDPARILGERPDAVVLVSRREDRLESPEWSLWERPIFDACIAAGFVPVGAPRHFADDYWLWVLARPESAVARGLDR
jgi:hypothetical protein